MMGGQMLDKNAWHFVPGWPGHMSQMKSGGKASGTGSDSQAQAAQGQGGHGGSHLNVFYSGKPDDEEEEEDQEV